MKALLLPPDFDPLSSVGFAAVKDKVCCRIESARRFQPPLLTPPDSDATDIHAVSDPRRSRF